MKLHPLLLLTALVAMGCGGKSPSLSNLTYDGPAPDSSLVLLLSVTFADDEGDLAGGQLDTFINQQPTSVGPLKLLPIFIGSDVDAHATDGTLDFVLELAFQDEIPPSGSTFTLGVSVVDGAQNTSETEELKLRLQNE